MQRYIGIVAFSFSIEYLQCKIQYKFSIMYIQGRAAHMIFKDFQVELSL